MKTPHRLGTAKPRRKLGRALIAVMAAAVILGVAPASAMAATVGPATVGVSAMVSPAAVVLIPGPSALVSPKLIIDGDPCLTCASEPRATSQSNLIPINRWSKSSGVIHFRQNGLDPIGLAANSVRIGTEESLLSWISTIWSGTAQLSDMAANLQPVNKLGFQIDKATASLGNILFDNPLIFTLTAIGLLLGAIWNKSRGRDGTGLLKRALGVVLVLIVIGSMSAGATKSKQVGDVYTPGMASPGWIITEIQTLIGSATNAALSGVNTDIFTTGSTTVTGPGKLSCSAYTSALHNLYQDKKMGNSSSMAAISSMWETAGLRTWVNAQFGANNSYGDQVWCHRADALTGISVARQIDYTLTGVNGAAKLRQSLGAKSPAFNTSNEVDDDRNIIAWAACQWDGDSWYVQKGFRSHADGSTWIEPGNCENWWGATGDIDMVANHFNIGTGEAGQLRVNELTNDDHVRDFANSWQGTDSGAGTTTLIVWSILAAVVLFLILGVGLSGAVLVAKLLTVVVMMMMMLVLIGSLFSTEGPGPRVVKMLKQLVGYTVLASGASAIFVLITWMTQMLIALGVTTVGAGSTPALIWTAMAPIIAMFVLHMLFKKFNLPSPMTPKGALAWGAAGGAAGGIIGSGLVNRLGGKAKNIAGKAVEDRGSSMLHSATRGRFGTESGASGKSRAGAGAPPAVGGGAKTDKKTSEKISTRDALRHARKIAAPAPMNAAERAGAEVRGRASATGKGIGAGIGAGAGWVGNEVGENAKYAGGLLGDAAKWAGTTTAGQGARLAAGAVGARAAGAGAVVGAAGARAGAVGARFGARVGVQGLKATAATRALALQQANALKDGAAGISGSVRKNYYGAKDHLLSNSPGSALMAATVKHDNAIRARAEYNASDEGMAKAQTRENAGIEKAQMKANEALEKEQMKQARAERESALSVAAKSVHAATSKSIAAKAAKFREDPAAGIWNATKTTAKVGGFALGTVVTGGALIPVAVAVKTGKVAIAKKKARAIEVNNAREVYSTHLAAKAAQDNSTSPAAKPAALPKGSVGGEKID